MSSFSRSRRGRERPRTPALRGSFLLGAALLAAACGPSPKGPETAPPGSGKLSLPGLPPLSASSAPRLPDSVDFEVTLSPEPSPTSLVHVTLSARPDDAPLTVWQSPKPVDLTAPPEAVDDIGPIPLVVDAAGGGTRVLLSKAPTGVVRVTYTVRAQLPAYPDPPLVAVDPDRFEGAGEALILVPAPFEERSVRAVLRMETEELGTSELRSEASSFGLGSKVETTARGADLREGFFLAGLIGRATFRAPEGNDDAAWLGYTAFDPRPVVADMAGFRTALRQLFGAPDTEKLMFLFLSDTRFEGAFVVSRRPRSIITRIGVQERWSAPLRIAVATSVVHGWIGARLWVGPNDREHEAEAYWFTEGVARQLARDLLFRFGLISPSEAAQEVEGLASVLATSPLASASNAELGRKPKAAVPLLVARGALYALRTDALLRERTQKKRSLDHVLRELYEKAAAARSALPASAWTDAIVKDLGDPERAFFRDTIELGKPFDVPEGALGPCFRRVTRAYTGFDAGFDEEATNRGKPRKLVGVVPGGPADKAGLREGDEVVSIQILKRGAEEPMEVTIARDGGTKKFKYKPEGKHGRGVGFERKKEVSDDACSQ
jgi:predicted metalloprotease with PDZ domain